jgi:hypothetical protein
MLSVEVVTINFLSYYCGGRRRERSTTLREMPLLGFRTRLRCRLNEGGEPTVGTRKSGFAAGSKVTQSTEIDRKQIVSSIRVLFLQNVQER